MEIIEVGQKEYSEIMNVPYHIFGSGSFNALNKDKCDQIFYLLFKEGKYRLGIVGGIRENAFYSPFSAPFGGFSYISQDIRIPYIEHAIVSLLDWGREKKFISINITLPPHIYNDSFIAKQHNCLQRKGFQLNNVDLNFSILLEKIEKDYTSQILKNARKNLIIAMNEDLKFRKCDNLDEKKQVYKIISKNRESKGYSLGMSWNQVAETIKIVPAIFFILTTNNDTPIASAIVFQINDSIVQVIYWGDVQGFSKMKPMNFLSFKIFEYFHKNKIKIVDIGTSTINSEPNYGLCEFKESIGCDVQTKLSFSIKL